MYLFTTITSYDNIKICFFFFELNKTFQSRDPATALQKQWDLLGIKSPYEHILWEEFDFRGCFWLLWGFGVFYWGGGGGGGGEDSLDTNAGSDLIFPEKQ